MCSRSLCLAVCLREPSTLNMDKHSSVTLSSKMSGFFYRRSSVTEANPTPSICAWLRALSPFFELLLLSKVSLLFLGSLSVMLRFLENILWLRKMLICSLPLESAMLRSRATSSDALIPDWIDLSVGFVESNRSHLNSPKLNRIFWMAF